MNTDVYFCIGNTHKVCEDYALCGENYVMISDGCSSAKDTDFGARILLKTAEEHVKNNNVSFEHIITTAILNCKILNLNLECLCATLLLVEAKENKFQTTCIGDGAIVAITKDNKLEVIEINFPSNAPYYLKYEALPEDKENYSLLFPRKKIIREWEIGNDEVHEYESENFEIFYREFPFEKYKAVAITSDGLFSFFETVVSKTMKTVEKIETDKILSELISLQHTKGEFMRRNCTYLFKKYKGWYHTDDFSIGAITQ